MPHNSQAMLAPYSQQHVTQKHEAAGKPMMYTGQFKPPMISCSQIILPHTSVPLLIETPVNGWTYLVRHENTKTCLEMLIPRE